MTKKGRNDLTVKALRKAILEVLSHEPRIGCEVGIWEGSTSKRLLEQFPCLSLLMIDNYPQDGLAGVDHRTIDEILDAMREAMLVTSFAADRRSFWYMSSKQAQAFIPDGFFDFVYIDADHSEESVAADFNYWYPKVREGGLLTGHDYDGRGDRKGTFGVKKAVDKTAEIRGLEVQTAGKLVWYVKKESGS